MIKASTAKEIERSPYNGSVSREDFNKIAKSRGLDVRTTIDSVYKYSDPVTEKDYFYYPQTRHARLHGDEGLMQSFESHIGKQENEFDEPAKEFELTKENLARIKKQFTRRTNFYVVDGQFRKALTREQFEATAK